MQIAFESDRLAFRPLAVDDLDITIAQWTDPDVTRYAGGQVYSKEELADDMPLITRRCAGGCIGTWLLTRKDTGEKIGSADLLPMPREGDDTDWDLVTGDKIPDRDIEIGYILIKKAWGKGYATEACRRLLKFAYEDSPLDEIVANIHPDNDASRRVLLKSGFAPIGLIRAYGHNLPGFRITRAAWLAQAGANHP